MSSTVVRPPRPCAPMPSALTLSNSSSRISSSRFDGPRDLRSTMSIGSISDSLASSIAFSAVPPMPIPSMPGGHQPAPIVGTVFSTQSTIESDGLSIANFDFLRAATLGRDDHVHRIARHHLDVHHARRVVAGVAAAPGRAGPHPGAPLVVRVPVGAAPAPLGPVLPAPCCLLPAPVHSDPPDTRSESTFLADSLDHSNGHMH